MYTFEHENLRFSSGGLDELIALDRYAVSSVDPSSLRVGDTVVFIADPAKGTRKVGIVTADNATNGDGSLWSNTSIQVVDRGGTIHVVPLEHVVKPFETKPHEFWSRWALGAALVEYDRARVNPGPAANPDESAHFAASHFEDEFRWLLDGYRYSPGGRIQLGLGHEYLELDRSKLTLMNCFVGPNVEGDTDEIVQWRHVIDTLRRQIEVQRKGGGYGDNITKIETIKGAPNVDVYFVLDESHDDFAELQRLRAMGRFEGVTYVGSETTNQDHGPIYVGDSIDGILSALRKMIASFYTGHDVQLDFSALRPRHAPVADIGRSSGAASWMTLFALAVRLLRQETIDAVDFAELFAFTTNLVEQGGSRRGARMIVYNVDGPHIEKFIAAKRTPGRLVGTNISVAVTDEFMAKVKRYVKAAEDEFGDYGDDASQHLYEEDREAHRIWSLIVESAHASGEPGVIFIDRVNAESNSRHRDRMDATNPCGEQPLPPNGSCNLGHLVLPRFVIGEWTYEMAGGGTVASVDYFALEQAVRLAVRFQDNIIDYTTYPTPEMEVQAKKERRVGIGTMGLGTMLIMLGLRYGSDDAIAFIDDLYENIAYWAYDESMNLAAEKGAFPAFEYEEFIQSEFALRLFENYPCLRQKLRTHGIRNVTLLTQAPTGTTGTMLANLFDHGMTTGIEPEYFLGDFYRASRLGEGIAQEAKIVETYRKANDLGPGDPLPDYFVSTMDLSPSDHVRVQATIQRWVDSSISKTINFPSSATVDDVAKAYMLGYDEGVKGMTVYVDGSREAQVLSTTREGAKLEAHIEAESARQIVGVDVADGVKTSVYASYDGSTMTVDRIEQEATDEKNGGYAYEKVTFPKRPQRTYGFTEKLRVPTSRGTSKVYVTVNIDGDGRPYEVFVNANDPEHADTARALGVILTQFLRYGATNDNVGQAIKHLRRGQSNMMSLPSQVARLLEGVSKDEREPVVTTNVPARTPSRNLSTCPDCGEETYDKTACTCASCGFSRCS